jgi:hypothetical protein
LIVWVDDRLFEDGATDTDRIALLRNTAVRRHTLIVSRHPDDSLPTRTSPAYDRWINGFPGRLSQELNLLRERLELVSANSVTRGCSRLLVTDTPETYAGDNIDRCTVSLKHAIRAVNQPLYVLVENQINDAEFLRSAMPPEWAERLKEWEARGELHYENGGGVTVMKSIVEFHTINANSERTFGLPSEVWRLFHFLIYDHDGQSANVPGEQSALLNRCCEDSGLNNHSHMLERREQENYIPIEAMQHVTESQVPDPKRKTELLDWIQHHNDLGNGRHFQEVDKFFKNKFQSSNHWNRQWFKDDGAWPEMTRLAEKIAAAM